MLSIGRHHHNASPIISALVHTHVYKNIACFETTFLSSSHPLLSSHMYNAAAAAAAALHHALISGMSTLQFTKHFTAAQPGSLTRPYYHRIKRVELYAKPCKGFQSRERVGWGLNRGPVSI